MEGIFSVTEQTRNLTVFDYIQVDACRNWAHQRESQLGNKVHRMEVIIQCLL